MSLCLTTVRPLKNTVREHPEVSLIDLHDDVNYVGPPLSLVAVAKGYLSVIPSLNLRSVMDKNLFAWFHDEELPEEVTTFLYTEGYLFAASPIAPNPTRARALLEMRNPNVPI